MSRGAARQTVDKCNLKGLITVPVACSVTVNGKPAAHKGSICLPHLPKAPHKFPQPIITGSCSVTVEGKPMARARDMTKCFCIINPGSCDVFVGD